MRKKMNTELTSYCCRDLTVETPSSSVPQMRCVFNWGQLEHGHRAHAVNLQHLTWMNSYSVLKWLSAQCKSDIIYKDIDQEHSPGVSKIIKTYLELAILRGKQVLVFSQLSKYASDSLNPRVSDTVQKDGPRSDVPHHSPWCYHTPFQYRMCRRLINTCTDYSITFSDVDGCKVATASQNNTGLGRSQVRPFLDCNQQGPRHVERLFPWLMYLFF